jgi:chloramphenicol 3-O-phosphotransferase
MSQIVIVSGGSGAGKSSACESLCERYDRTVHLETDDVFAWVRMGFVQPWKPGSMEQNHMISRAVARAATAFAQRRFGVFIDGVIGPHLLPDYIEELKPAGVPMHYAVLLPPVEVGEKRAHKRGERIMGGPDLFARVQSMFEGDLPGWSLDNSNLSADQTADRIMDACARGQALVWSPE